MTVTSLRDLFEIAADAYESGDERFQSILDQAGDAAPWYWIIGPTRGRPKPAIRLRWPGTGLMGRSFLEPGFVYAPYIPVIVAPVIYKYDDENPGKVMARYAKQTVRSDFYGLIHISGSVV